MSEDALAQLKNDIFKTRASLTDNSIDLCFDCDWSSNFYGYNCLHCHFIAVGNGDYAVYQNFYLEYAYEGRNPNLETHCMFIQKGKPTSKQAKESLLNWMIEKRKD